MLRLIRKFFSGIPDYPHQDWWSDDDDEAGMDTDEPDTTEWVNPYQQLFIACQLRRIQTLEADMDAGELGIDDYHPLGQPLWDGESINYVDGSNFNEGTVESNRYPHTHK